MTTHLAAAQLFIILELVSCFNNNLTGLVCSFCVSGVYESIATREFSTALCVCDPWANPPRAIEAFVLITDLIIILI